MKLDYSRTILTGLVLAGSAILIGGCELNHGSLESYWAFPSFPDDVIVMVKFDDYGCPKSADPDKFIIKRSKKVAWQAVDANDKPIEMEYSIFFNPFRGRDLSSKIGDLGRTPLSAFSQAAIDLAGTVEYKYSIVSKTTCEPLDPRFRLR